MDGVTAVLAVFEWAKKNGFSPVLSVAVTVGVALLWYCGKIVKGIRAGYGVILQDQKDAAAAMRNEVATLRGDYLEAITALAKERDAHLNALAELGSVKAQLAAVIKADKAT